MPGAHLQSLPITDIMTTGDMIMLQQAALATRRPKKTRSISSYFNMFLVSTFVNSIFHSSNLYLRFMNSLKKLSDYLYSENANMNFYSVLRVFPASHLTLFLVCMYENKLVKMFDQKSGHNFQSLWCHYSMANLFLILAQL